MYYTWQNERINAKVVFWGAEGVGTTTAVHGVSASIEEMVEAGEADPPGPEQAVGMRRNNRPVEINEDDRKLTVYFFRPPGGLGEFGGHELHYKVVAPEGKPEENRAYTGVFDGVSAVVLMLDARRGRQDANREAVERLAGHLERRFEPEAVTTDGVLEEVVRGGDAGSDGDVAMVVQVTRMGAESALEAEAIVRQLRLPGVPVVETSDARRAEEVWPVVEELRGVLEPMLRAAKERGRIPE